MARFEKRITDAQVAKARETIADGATLREAAAQVPCAPSTLSYRIKQLKQAGSAAAEGPEQVVQSPTFVATAASGRGAESIGALDTLREALRATKDGEPHWPTRIAAARALAALRPDEVQPRPPDGQAEPEFVVYDLPPGSPSVVHRAVPSKEASTPPAEPSPTAGEPEPAIVMFFYQPVEGDSETIGSWTPPHAGTGIGTFLLRHTADRKTADRWRSDLAAGRLPESNEPPARTSAGG